MTNENARVKARSNPGDHLRAAREKRRFHRYMVKFPCAVKPLRARQESAQADLVVHTQDISSGGLFFVASAPWEVGTPIECVIQLTSKAFGGRSVGVRCRGRIARLVPNEQGGVGIGATIDRFEFVHFYQNEL